MISGVQITLFKREVDRQIEELKKDMSEEEQQKYMFNVTKVDDKVKVVKILKPPMPIISME